MVIKLSGEMSNRLMGLENYDDMSINRGWDTLRVSKPQPHRV
jgi:hypothetical protein